MNDVVIERLCQHHLVGVFDAGPTAAENNVLLRRFAESFDDGDASAPITYCAVDKSNGKILGFISLSDLIVQGSESEQKLYMAIVACAISQHVHADGSAILFRLLRRSLRWMESRSDATSRQYRGVIAFNVDSPGTLSRLGFSDLGSLKGSIFAPTDRLRAALKLEAEPMPKPAMYSTFISFGGPDESFARKIYLSLTLAGVPTYFFPETARLGERIQTEVYREIQKHDKVILLCSRASLRRPGVLQEIEETLDREGREGGKPCLLPIMLDDYVLTGWYDEQPDLAKRVGGRVAGDFRTARNNSEDFEKAMSRLLAALRNEPPQIPLGSGFAS